MAQDETKDFFFSDRTVGMPGAVVPGETGSGTRIVENFTADDGTSLSGRLPAPTNNGNAWNIEGTVTIQGNRSKIHAAGNGAWIDLGTNNQDIRLTYNFGDSNNWAWFTFARDSGNDAAPQDGYRVFLSSGTVALKRVTGGVEVELQSTSVALALNTDHAIVINHNASTNLITVSINGFQVINSTDGTPPTLGTYGGFYASTQIDDTARYDTFDTRELAGATISCTSADLPLTGEQADFLQDPSTIECASSDTVIAGSAATLRHFNRQPTVGYTARVWGRRKYSPLLPQSRKKYQFTEEDIEAALDKWIGRF